MQSQSLLGRGSTKRGLCRAPTNIVPSVALRKVWAAVASPETMKPMKMKKDKCTKDALYLFQWHRPSQGTTDARQLCDELKTLEKVSKDAVWFTVKEAPTGGQHVLVVTADSKAARKYSLTELTEPVVSLELEGMTEPVEVPVATLKASLEAMMDESSSSDSSEDDEPMIMQPKDKKKKEDKKKKTKMELPMTVEEGPAAAAEAASLMRAMVEGGHGEPIVVGVGAKMERTKLKDAVKEVDAIPQAGTVPVKAMDDNESSSSGSSSCSEDECDKDQGMKGEGMKMAKMEMGKKGKDESSESESSGSESDEECEKGKVKVVVQPVIVA